VLVDVQQQDDDYIGRDEQQRGDVGD